MKTRWNLILFVALLLLVTGAGFLSACNLLEGQSASQADSRIAKLETELQANAEKIAKLQQQVQELQGRISALTPAPVAPGVPIAPPAPTAPTTPTTPPPLQSLRRVTFGKLTISPLEVKIGETVTVTIEASNPGDTEGSYNIVFVEKQLPQLTSDILEYAYLETFKPKETKTLTFTLSKDAPGTYEVTVGDKVGQFVVLSESSPSS